MQLMKTQKCKQIKLTSYQAQHNNFNGIMH